MILYVNGDSHAAAAEAATPHAFAEDDHKYFYLGRAPHPTNFSVSWAKLLSLSLRSPMQCDAESASSNARILRTSRAWLEQQANQQDLLLIIQWSTWEREEWLHNGIYYQVGSSGIDDVPQELQEKYQNFVIVTDWKSKTEQAHKEIWEFHKELEEQGIKHIFFNGNNDFSLITEQLNWGTSYIGPYDPGCTYDALIRAQKIETVAPNSWHFGRDGHRYFNHFMLKYINDHKFI